jgi:hypothetical protein
MMGGTTNWWKCVPSGAHRCSRGDSHVLQRCADRGTRSLAPGTAGALCRGLPLDLLEPLRGQRHHLRAGKRTRAARLINAS